MSAPYVGTYTNQHGEVWVFTCDGTTARLIGQDVNWQVREVTPQRLIPWVMSPAEMAWVAACMVGCGHLEQLPEKVSWWRG